MEEGFGRSTRAQADPNRRQMIDAVEWTAIDGSRVRWARVVNFQIDASLAMAQLRDVTETFAGYRATMEEITSETIMAIYQLRQLTDGVRQTTMQSVAMTSTSSPSCRTEGPCGEDDASGENATLSPSTWTRCPGQPDRLYGESTGGPEVQFGRL